MNNSDFIVALYYPYSSNHVYASPNKSYEALFLSTPIITSKGTLVGDKVAQTNTGYIVDDTLEGLHNLFANVETEDFKRDYLVKCNNCAAQWKQVYADYKSKTLEGKYLDMIKSLFS